MAANTPLAIIGMSCRFAGDVDNPEKLWNLLAEGRSAWSEIPKDRFNIDGFHHPNFEKLNGVSTSNELPASYWWSADRLLINRQMLWEVTS